MPGVFVESCGKPDPVGKPQTQELDRIVDGGTRDQPKHGRSGSEPIECPKCNLVGAFGVKPEQQGPSQSV
jgi:hypothetical protein